MHAYLVTCEGQTPETKIMQKDRNLFYNLTDAESIARTYDETHDGARCTERHRVFQVNFVEIPRED